jgi:hypothetical protein
MFGAKARLHYRINMIGEDGSIGGLLPQEFGDMDEVIEYLNGN